jgi:hypothetical protein
MQQHQKLNQIIFTKVFFVKYLKIIFFILVILDLSDDTGGFLGRRLNQAMSWVRGSNVAVDPSTLPLPLQTCLTYLTLPCHFIVKDILESNSTPILTIQQSNSTPILTIQQSN